MRQRPGLSSVPAIAAWAAMTFLSACGTLGDGPGKGKDRRADQAQVAANDDDDDDCELLVVKRGEAARVVDEKTPEMADAFYLLGSNRDLLEQFQVEDDEEAACLIAFGLQSGGLSPAAFGAMIPIPALAGLLAVVGAGVGLGALSGGGTSGGPTSTPNTQ